MRDEKNQPKKVKSKNSCKVEPKEKRETKGYSGL